MTDVRNAAAVERATSESSEQYDRLLKMARAVFEGERDFVANMANLSSLIYHRLEDLNWCGFYLSRGSELVLGPFQGKVACVRIAVGKGVCGTAAAEKRTVLVPDVAQFAGHIACDPSSRSEIVVPLVSGGRLVGVLDVDSPRTDRFRERDAGGLSKLAELLVSSSDVPPVGANP